MPQVAFPPYELPSVDQLGLMAITYVLAAFIVIAASDPPQIPMLFVVSLLLLVLIHEELQGPAHLK